MELYTIDIRSWTASFRYPNLISGIQPTLEAPPLSTVLGLINAAAGYYVSHKQLTIGYYFEFQGELKEVDNAEKIRGQIIPFTNNHLPGVIQALPKYFTDTIPRNNIGTESYSVLNHQAKVKSNLKAYRDEIGGKEIDIYLHQMDFETM